MPHKRQAVRLTGRERSALLKRLEDPRLAPRQRRRIEALVRSDAGEPDRAIADDLGVSTRTVAMIRRNFALGGVHAAVDAAGRWPSPLLDGS